jgi:hypothetical protein
MTISEYYYPYFVFVLIILDKIFSKEDVHDIFHLTNMLYDFHTNNTSG